jgi:hypothetical protein
MCVLCVYVCVCVCVLRVGAHSSAFCLRSALTSLTLSDNIICDDGVRSLVAALDTNTALLTLDLGANRFYLLSFFKIRWSFSPRDKNNTKTCVFFFGCFVDPFKIRCRGVLLSFTRQKQYQNTPKSFFAVFLVLALVFVVGRHNNRVAVSLCSCSTTSL